MSLQSHSLVYSLYSVPPSLAVDAPGKASGASLSPDNPNLVLVDHYHNLSSVRGAQRLYSGLAKQSGVVYRVYDHRIKQFLAD